jgi:hypothetical protein
LGLRESLGLSAKKDPFSDYEALAVLADGLGIAMADPVDPRRRTTGTSYNAKGSIPVDAGAIVEAGSGRVAPIRDIVPELATRGQAIQVYDRMANNSAPVDVSLRAGKMPIVGADFFVEPYTDKGENLEIAQFVEYNLLQSQTSPFLNVLQDFLRMMEHGFSIGEKVFEEREWTPTRDMANRRRYTMLRKIAPRLAPTITEFMYDDNGGPVGVEHMAIRADNRPQEVEIPIHKMVILTHNKKGGNLEGKSLLRTAYKNWVYQENLYKIDGIQKERHGMGFPILELPPTANDNDIRVGLELISNIRTNERAGAVLPTGWVLRFADMPGQPVDVLRSIEHHNGMIMLNVMVQFLLMGVAEGGGRATAGSHQDMFTKSQRYLANLVCDMFNLYVIPQLVAYNFETDMFPQLRVRNIGETRDLQQWAAALANLSARNLITLDLDTEQWVRSKIDAPLKLGEKQTPEANVPPVKEPSEDEAFGGDNGKGDVQGGEEGNQGSKDNQGGG